MYLSYFEPARLGEMRKYMRETMFFSVAAAVLFVDERCVHLR